MPIAAAGFSRMYAGFSADLMQWLHKENISFNNHAYGVTMDTFNSHPKLKQFYTVLSTSVDKSGKEFISSIEGNFLELDLGGVLPNPPLPLV